MPSRTRPPIGYHSGAIVTVWPTTCRSRQHSARRLSRLNDVLPPCRYARSIAARAVGGIARGQAAAGPLLERRLFSASERVPQLGDHRAAVGAAGVEDRVGPPD